MKNDFFKDLNELFVKEAPDLKISEDDSHHYFVIDENETEISTFPILQHEERYIWPDNADCDIHLSVYYDGQCSDVLRMKASDLFNLNAYITKFGNKPFAAFTKNSWVLFFTVIKAMLAQIKQQTVYMYSGWTGDLNKFLHGNCLIDECSVLTVQSSLVKNDVLLSNKPNQEIVRAVDDIVRRLYGNKLIGYILLMYLFLSCTKQRTVLTCHTCPEFSLDLDGKTGSCKTSTALAVYNTVDGSVSSFEDTQASIRRMLQANKAGATIVDDYKVSNAKNDTKYEQIVRLCGDSNTTGKYVSGNKVVDDLITGMCVITGERRPNLQQSSYSRILLIDVNSNPVNLAVLTELQESKAEINSLVVLFVQHILKKPDFDNNLVAMFHKQREELLQDPQYQGMHKRYYGMAAWLSAIWSVYVDFMQQYGVAVEYDFDTEIKKYIYEQHCRYNDDPIKLFHAGYLELLSANELVVVSNEGIEDVNFDVVEYDNMLFIKSNSVYKKVCAFWLAKGIEFPCSERKLRQLLWDIGILEQVRGNMTTEKKTHNNRSFSGYYLLKNTFLNCGGKKHEKF